MKAVLTLLKANIKHKKGSFRSIAILMAIITFSFSCTVSNNDNLRAGIESSFENYDVGDLLITIDERDMNDELTAAIENSTHVSGFRTEQLIAAEGGVYLNDNKLDSQARLVMADEKLRVFNSDVNGFDAGRYPESGEVFVGYSLGKMSSLELGDKVRVTASGGDEIFTVAGYAEDPIGGSVSVSCDRFFISPSDFDRIVSEKLDDENAPFRRLHSAELIHIFGDGELSETGLAAELNDSCGIIGKAMMFTKRSELVSSIKFFADMGTRLLAVYMILLVAAVVIIIHNTVSSSIEMEYTDLGILRAQGFSAWQIRLAYIIQYAMALVIGLVIGMIVSFPMTAVFGQMFIMLTGILTTGQVSVLKCTGLAAVITVMCTISSVISTERIRKLSPVSALRGGGEDIYFSSLLSVPVRKKPLLFFIALRQLTSRAASYIGTCLIAALLVFFMISVGVMAEGLNVKELLGDMSSVKAAAVLSDSFTFEDMDRIKSELSYEYPDTQIRFRSAYDVSVQGMSYTVTVTDDARGEVKVYDGRAPEYDNEIAITDIVAEETGKSLGDTISVHTGNGTEEMLVTGLYRTSDEMGRTFAMSWEGGKKLGIPVRSMMVINSQMSAEESEVLAKKLNDSYGDIMLAEKYKLSPVKEGLLGITDILMKTIVAVVYSISCVFALVVVVILCSKALKREQRDTGIYKAIGFSSGALRLQFSLRFLIVSLAGSVMGAVLSGFFTAPLFSVLLRRIGIADFTKEGSILSVISPVIVISGCFFIFSYLYARRIKKVEVRELITE